MPIQKKLRRSTNLKASLFFILCYTFSILLCTYKYIERFSLASDVWSFNPPLQQGAHQQASSYLQHALTGPRKCISASCYIVDVIADPYQPRIFLNMLGLPASDIPRNIRGRVTNVSFVDIRSDKWMLLTQSWQLVNGTHTYAVLLTGQKNKVHLLATCSLLHHGLLALNAFYESTTYACDLDDLAEPMEQLMNEKQVRVDVLLAPLTLNAAWSVDLNQTSYLNLNGVDAPFYIYNNHHDSGKSTGLFNSVSRRVPDQSASEYHKATIDIPKISACLIGVNYISPQHREVIQYYITSGFEHIYLGVPLWPTSQKFYDAWNMLSDFVKDGSLSIIISEYAKDFIEPERFGLNFTYAPQGHKSSFVNTCILAARSAGDDLVYVGDMDELVEFKYGNATTIGEAVLQQLSARKMKLSQLCQINCGAVGGLYHPNQTGYRSTARIKDKLAAVGNVSDSVATYGKSILNVKRVLRAGLHGVAYCEAPWMPDLANTTRSSIIDGSNSFRADFREIRILHLTDSYRQRSAPWMIKMAKQSNDESYYIRDFSSLVHSKIEERRNAT